ncbi:zinc finger-like domain-containing protein [Parabacteroides provencensis]|uniref:zinc finger-like domain-containing protein n=1 Tax=Parabacteroides provencensis TaxID=1944636 RepID=UPI000C160CE1|nr:zinc finger-like domain-containing protein [Parabacteroides provencensis]
MSIKQNSILVIPPEYQEVWEKISFTGYRCPVCNGQKSFSEQVGYNQYEEKACDYCKGTGKVKAEITINWVPDAD